MSRISIITSGHFSTSPRVWREADALSNAGHEVRVIGVSYDPYQAEMDTQMLRSRSWRYIIAADLRSRSWSSRCHRQLSRLRTRAGKMLLSKGWPNPHAFGYAVGSLLDVALIKKADLTILHLEPALWAGLKLRQRGLAIGVDIEDWYSENCSEGRTSPMADYLRFLEREVLKGAVHATTMSHAMAGALCITYGVPPPEVIYNADPAPLALAVAPSTGPLRMLWFSQTIGPGRGLEDLCAVLPHLVGHWKLEIRGTATDQARNWIESLIPSVVRDRVSIEPQVRPEHLLEIVSTHELGLALDPPVTRHKDLTVSNKMIQYLQAGLQVVAADTSGTREIQSAIPGVVELYPAGQNSDLSTLLNAKIQSRASVISSRASIFHKSNALFSFDHQSPRFLASIDRALKHGKRSQAA